MDYTIDLDAYLRRVQWSGGAPQPDSGTLARLLRAHMEHIPFENLDVLLGRTIALDPAALEDKLVRTHRGGYCFEHASLFGVVLETIGFEVARHTARVVLFKPPELAARTHMFLTVVVEGGRVVVDPGFGGQASRVPIPLQAGVEAHDGARAHWFTRNAHGEWLLQARFGDERIDCWIADLRREHPVDFEMSNHFVSTHRGSAFVQRLMLRACHGDEAVSVMNRDVTRTRGESVTHATLEDRRALRALLRDDFGFDLPEVESLRVPDIPEWT